MRRSQAPIGNLKGTGIVAVAIDNDKNSQHALKWAADQMLTRGQIFYLLHVRRKIGTIPTHGGGHLSIHEVDEDVASTFLDQQDAQTKNLILPFQCFCSRRGLQCKEVILDGMDVPKAIIDFIQHRSIDKLIMGACSRNAIVRTFKSTDVPTSVCKTAPDTCCIYVISKGKISSVRPATRQNSTYNKSQIAQMNDSHHSSHNSNNTTFQSVKNSSNAGDPYTREYFDATPRSSFDRGSVYDYDDRISDKIKWCDTNENTQGTFVSCPSPLRNSTDQPHPPPEAYTRRDKQNLSGRRQNSLLNNHNATQDPNSFYQDAPQQLPYDVKDKTEDVEEELIRLKLELKQKAEMSLEEDYKEASRKYDKERGEREERRERRERGEDSPPAKQRNPPLVPETREKLNLLEGFNSEMVYRQYRLEEIEEATDYFSDSLKVGEGGYGPVYKSTLDHKLVAIKALRSDISSTQASKQFQQELEVLIRIRHPNMVLLVGACPDNGSLVYEYMSNGSLEDRLACQAGTAPLPWQLRFKIACEIATGLLFLHQQRPEPIVHRDLKPGNILLDHNLVAKIADVGLARLIPSPAEGLSSTSTSLYRMTAAAGTFCYIDPEYQKTGMVGTKSDVYALGIIFLQLITGRAPMGLAHKLMNALEGGKLAEILDPKVTDWPMEETSRLAELALKCCELRRRDRPDLGSEVLPVLKQLANFAESKEDENFIKQRQRCQSFKDWNTGMASFAEAKTIKGSTFMM